MGGEIFRKIIDFHGAIPACAGMTGLKTGCSIIYQVLDIKHEKVL
jgi:hypothetical protein